MYFRAPCPVCGGHGGKLKTTLFSDSIAGLLEKAGRDMAGRCATCNGTGDVFAKLVTNPEDEKPAEVFKPKVDELCFLLCRPTRKNYIDKEGHINAVRAEVVLEDGQKCTVEQKYINRWSSQGPGESEEMYVKKV